MELPIQRSINAVLMTFVQSEAQSQKLTKWMSDPSALKSIITDVRERKYRFHFIWNSIWLSALFNLHFSGDNTWRAFLFYQQRFVRALVKIWPMLVTLVYILIFNKATDTTIYQFKRLSNTIHISSSFLCQTHLK